MGTFLAPFPSPQPVFRTAEIELSSTTASADAEYSSTILASPDAEFSSLIIAFLAMHDDIGAGSQPNAPFAAVVADADADADAANFPLLFAAHEHDHHQAVDSMMMPLPPQVFADLPVNPIPSSVVQGSLFPAAAGEGGATGSTSRSGKRRRPQTRSSQPDDDAPGESSGGGQAHAPARARASRRVWVRKRSTEWWDHLDGPSCPDAEFRRAFRMSRATFGALCDALGGAIAKEDTALRAAIPVGQRVAVCLWRLATAEPLREVSRRFGLGISTCHSIVLQVYHALAAVLRPTAISWPDDPVSAAAVAARFEAASGGLPGIVGAVYTTRVPVVAPKGANVAAYYDRGLTERNKKASYSVAVQAVADADGAFTDVWIEPGSLSDTAVLGRWALCGILALGGHGGQEQRLVGGTSYPLMDWMLVPYSHHNLTWTEHAFNERVARARGVARGAVRRLKARWRCLQRRSEVKMQDLPSMIAACCVLHNVCERAGEELDPDLMQYELDDDDSDVVAHDDTAPSAPAVQAARDRIAHGLLHGSHASN